MKTRHVGSMSAARRVENPDWLGPVMFVVIMMTVTWLALWAASKGGERSPAAAIHGTWPAINVGARSPTLLGQPLSNDRNCAVPL